METYHSRSQSFQKTKGSKSTSKSARSATLSWPHPDTFKATPSTLAEAGFYFNPSKEDPDNVTCFMCEKELGGWESEDDPFDIHTRKCPKCPWVVARCSLANDFDSDGNFTATDAKRLPNSKVMEKARLDTFRVNEKLWPHDSTKNHGATSKKMASAGFVYTPQVSGDDTATCYYCDLALSGWDKGDDPLEEHRKRESRSGKPCPFFHAQLQSRTKPSSAKPPPGDTLTSRKGKKNKVDVDVSSASESDAGVGGIGGAKGKGRKGSSKPPPSRSKPKSSAQKTRSAKTDEENTEQSELDVAPVKSTGATKKKKTISQAKPMSPVQEVTQEITEDEASEPSQTQGKSRVATKVKQKPPSARPASSRNTTTSSTLPEKHVDTMPEQSEPGDMQRPVKPAKKSTKKPPSSKPLSRAKSASTLRKAKPEKIEDSSDQSESEVAAVLSLPSRPETPSQTVTRSAETTTEFLNDAQHSEPKEEPAAVEQKKDREKPSSRPPSRAKSGRSTKSAKTDDEGMEQPESEAALAEVDAAKKPRKNASKPPSRAKPLSSVRSSAKGGAEEDDTLDHEEMNMPAPEPKLPGTSKKKQQEAKETAMQVDKPPTPPPRPPNPEPTDLSEPTTPLDPPIVENIANPIDYADIAPPHIESPALFVPPLASFPMKQISSLSEEERSMTVEQWIRHEMDLQYEQLKRDGERRIEAFRQRAAEVRLRIEAL